MEGCYRKEKTEHIFPPNFGEFFDIALLILDIIWHHDLVERMEDVSNQLEEMDQKLSGLILSLNPATADQFKRLSTTTRGKIHHGDRNFVGKNKKKNSKKYKRPLFSKL